MRLLVVIFSLVCWASAFYHEKTRFDRSVSDHHVRMHDAFNKKQRILADGETHYTAYKDASQSVCYLERMRNNRIDDVNEWKRVTQARKKNLNASDRELSKIKAWRLAGPRIVDFCKGLKFVLLEEEKSFIHDTYPHHNELPKKHEPTYNRRFYKREARGKLKAQTQSQYLSIGGDKEGKAEAEATLQSSRALVSGSSGMGQAQSMSSGSEGCEGCLGYVPGSIISTLGSQQGTAPGTYPSGTVPGRPSIQIGSGQPGIQVPGGVTTGTPIPGSVVYPNAQIPGGTTPTVSQTPGGLQPGVQVTGPQPQYTGGLQPGVQMTGQQPQYTGGRQPGVQITGQQPQYTGGLQPGVQITGQQPQYTSGLQPGIRVTGQQPQYTGGLQPGVQVPGQQPQYTGGLQPGVQLTGQQPQYTGGLQPGVQLTGQQPQYTGGLQPGVQVTGQPGVQVTGPQPQYTGGLQPGTQVTGPQPQYTGALQPGVQIAGQQPQYTGGQQPQYTGGMQPGVQVIGQPGTQIAGQQPQYTGGLQPGIQVTGQQPQYTGGLQPGVQVAGQQPQYTGGLQPGVQIAGQQPQYTGGRQPGVQVSGQQPQYTGGLQPGVQVTGQQPQYTGGLPPGVQVQPGQQPQYTGGLQSGTNLPSVSGGGQIYLQTPQGTGAIVGSGGGLVYPPGSQVAGGVIVTGSSNYPTRTQTSGGSNVVYPPGTQLSGSTQVIGGTQTSPQQFPVGPGSYPQGQQTIPGMVYPGTVPGTQPISGYPSGSVQGTFTGGVTTGTQSGVGTYPGGVLPGTQVPTTGVQGTGIATSPGGQTPITRGDIPGPVMYPSEPTQSGTPGTNIPSMGGVNPSGQVGYPNAGPGTYPSVNGLPGQYPSSIGQGQLMVPSGPTINIPASSGIISGSTGQGTVSGQGQTGVVAAGDDGSDSQAQSSVKQDEAGTHAMASAEGRHGQGSAKSQVSGTYSGGGSFSAQAGTSDTSKSAQTQVSGGKEGAKSSAQGSGGLGKSQVQVELDSDSGATSTNAQSSGWNHGTNSQVQASAKGGMADAQANGEGQTSSQAQIGFQPYINKNEKFEKRDKPFRGGGTASAQSGTFKGQTQSQLQGSFHYGITYTGAAQAGSGSGAAASRKAFNFTNSQSFKPLKFDKDKPVSSTETTQEPLQGAATSSRQTVISITPKNTYEKRSKSEKEDGNDDELDEYEDDEYNEPKHTTLSSIRQTMRVITDGDYDVRVKQEETTGRSSTGFEPFGNRQPKVTSIAGKKTIAQGDGKSQSQSVTIIPINRTTQTSRGDVKVQSSDTRSLHSERVGGIYYMKAPVDQQESSSPKTNYVSVSNSVAGKIEDKNSDKKYEHTYYTKSSTCGYFTFSCNVVYGSNGRRKICKPQLPTYPDGTSKC